jgi:hypothetical protein
MLCVYHVRPAQHGSVTCGNIEHRKSGQKIAARGFLPAPPVFY